jgi:hypothetical protein
VVGAVVLALGVWLLAGVVFKARGKTADGEARIVLEVDQPGAEVFVDGEKVRVSVPGDPQPLEIGVPPGMPCRSRCGWKSRRSARGPNSWIVPTPRGSAPPTFAMHSRCGRCTWGASWRKPSRWRTA